MWKRTMLSGAAAMATLVIGTGCSSSSDTGTEQSTGHMTSTSATAAATTAPAGQDHNQADIMFAHHMIPHHQQAIEMSDMLLAKQGIDPRVTELANQIKAAQGPEIKQMQDWLKQWGNPPMPPMRSGDMDMPGHGGTPMPSGNMPMPTTSGMPGPGGMAGMPGMMSDQDMTALQNAQGVEAAKLFLTQMIAHHEGAITMAQNELKDGQYPAAKEMAQAIASSQQKEIDTMKSMLDSL